MPKTEKNHCIYCIYFVLNIGELTDQLTSMNHNCSREAENLTVSQEITYLKQKLKFHYRVHMSSVPVFYVSVPV